MEEKRRFFTVKTPEHVELRLPLAEVGTRAFACGLDLALILLVIIVLGVLFSLLRGPQGSSLLLAFWILAFFLLRTFYFMFFEVRGRGRTPGKKKLGLRVLAADGGPLTAEQVVARNLTREFEIFLPLTALAGAGSALSDAPIWASWSLLLWIGGLGLFPVLSRRRARLGDVLAGTVVVVEPEADLHFDLADSGSAEPDYRFTKAQLDIYGIKELQVLEDVLHRPDSLSRTELLHGILDRVVTKIEWPEPVPYLRAEAFLHAFYAAQRHRLEHRMLLGDRREEKVR